MAGTIHSGARSKEYLANYARAMGRPEEPVVESGKKWWCTGCWHWFDENEDPQSTHKCEEVDRGD